MNLFIKSVTMRNFMSYGNNYTTVRFDSPGTTLIIGEDLDNTTNGSSSNGTGKTAALNALVYGLYDKPISDISKDKLINNINQKHMEVHVEFVADNGNTYIVKRARKMKAGAAGNTVHLYENGKDITPDSAKNVNAEIEKYIGIPYDIFVRIVVFTASQVPFLDLPRTHPQATNQTDIIEELFCMTDVSKKADLLSAAIKDTERKIESHLTKISVLEKEYERHQVQLESARKRVEAWESERENSLIECATKLKSVEQVDVQQQRTYHDMRSKLKSERSEQSSAIRLHDKRLKELTKAINSLNSELQHLADDKCPYCLQQFINADAKIAEIKAKIEVNQTEFDSSTVLAVDLQKMLDATNQQLKDIEGKITVDDIDELFDIKQQVSNIEQKMADLADAINPFIVPLQESESIKLDPIDYTPINEFTKLLEHQKFLHKLLTKKDSYIRKGLLDQNLPFLNDRLQGYLNDLGLPHTITFNHDMTAAISQFGQELDFGNLSAGQRARVNLALSWAFRDVRKKNLKTNINICLFDEVLDVGLDSVGVHAACKLLKSRARAENMSMFIISHREEVDGVFDRKMIVQLNQGFSSIDQPFDN